MLKGLSPLLSPELLSTLYAMGHGEEILLADAHFPGHQFCNNVIRADGHRIPDLLRAILPLFELDQYVEEPMAMMAAVPGDELDPKVESDYRAAIGECVSQQPKIERVERFAYYERAKGCHAVVMTGETAKYGNLILKKGVTPC